MIKKAFYLKCLGKVIVQDENKDIELLTLEETKKKYPQIMNKIVVDNLG